MPSLRYFDNALIEEDISVGFHVFGGVDSIRGIQFFVESKQACSHFFFARCAIFPQRATIPLFGSLENHLFWLNIALLAIIGSQVVVLTNQRRGENPAHL